jgi:uncharacterized membrane protein YeaQ/YmgE (transglycosylase-associated protein family)
MDRIRRSGRLGCQHPDEEQCPNVGIIGAFAGSFILSLLNVKGMTGFNVYTFFVALLGATVLLWLFNMIRGRR